MGSKFTLKDISLSFDKKDDTATLEGDISLCEDVCDFLKTTGRTLEITYDVNETTGNGTFRCVVNETDDLKKEWADAVAANENGCKKDYFMNDYAIYNDGDECHLCNRDLSLRLLTCGRLELATANHDHEEMIYSLPFTQVVEEMSIDTVKYLASILNARIEKENI